MVFATGANRRGIHRLDAGHLQAASSDRIFQQGWCDYRDDRCLDGHRRAQRQVGDHFAADQLSFLPIDAKLIRPDHKLEFATSSWPVCSVCSVCCWMDYPLASAGAVGSPDQLSRRPLGRFWTISLRLRGSRPGSRQSAKMRPPAWRL